MQRKRSLIQCICTREMASRAWCGRISRAVRDTYASAILPRDKGKPNLSLPREQRTSSRRFLHAGAAARCTRWRTTYRPIAVRSCAQWKNRNRNKY